MSNTKLICVQHNAEVVEVAGFKANPSLSSYVDLSCVCESSRPHLCAGVYTKRRESTSTLQSYGITTAD